MTSSSNNYLTNADQATSPKGEIFYTMRTSRASKSRGGQNKTPNISDLGNKSQQQIQ